MENVKNTSIISGIEVEWHDVRQEPFMLHGFYEPITEPHFRRAPNEVAFASSEGIGKSAKQSTGGRVRFSTDSEYVAIRAKFLDVGRASHLTLLNSAGFDLYIDGEFGSRFVKEFLMSYDMKDHCDQILHLESQEMRSLTINFPIYSIVESLQVGIVPGSKICAPRPYRNLDPVIFYGSSIVHGTAASRPGTIYPSIISRELNIDFRNIGFSGMAKGEPALAKWMASLPMSVFVCDYDHNAPTVEHLENTHYALYETIREKNPDVPYIMVTRPDYWTLPREQEFILQRRDVIMASYLKARAAGDKNVYFIDGLSFNVGAHQYEMSLDSVHPNDAGFIRMADSIGTVIRHALEKKN
jgi:hypothetical protein